MIKDIVIFYLLIQLLALVVVVFLAIRRIKLKKIEDNNREKFHKL